MFAGMATRPQVTALKLSLKPAGGGVKSRDRRWEQGGEARVAGRGWRQCGEIGYVLWRNDFRREETGAEKKAGDGRGRRVTRE